MGEETKVKRSLSRSEDGLVAEVGVELSCRQSLLGGKAEYLSALKV